MDETATPTMAPSGSEAYMSVKCGETAAAVVTQAAAWGLGSSQLLSTSLVFLAALHMAAGEGTSEGGDSTGGPSRGLGMPYNATKHDTCCVWGPGLLIDESSE